MPRLLLAFLPYLTLAYLTLPEVSEYLNIPTTYRLVYGAAPQIFRERECQRESALICTICTSDRQIQSRKMGTYP